jgi:predicted DNA-binding protein YlxM (UPF0122 family)
MKPDRSKLSAGTRSEEILKSILIVLDEINDKLDMLNKSNDKTDIKEKIEPEVTNITKIVSKVSSVDSKTRKK